MCAPEPPDAYETAAAQTGENLATAEANSWLNNVNRIGPDGSTTFNKIGTEKVWDANLNGKGQGGYREIPRFEQVNALSEMNQKIYDQSQNAKLSLAETGAERADFLQDYLKKPATYNDPTHMNWALGLHDQINQKHVNRGREGLESRLAAQGIQLGSTAYDRAMQNFETSQLDARNQFALDSYAQGENTFRANRAAPLNEVIGLLNGSQINVPQAPEPARTNIPTTDRAGLINAQYEAELAQHQARMGGLAQLGKGLFGLFGGF